jgi:hypothetical protein
MSPLITYLLIASLIGYAAIVVLEFVMQRRARQFLIQAGVVVLVVIVLTVTTGFPATRRVFGGANPMVAIAIMFVCTLLGIAAQYFFSLRRAFSWRTLLKPMCITPIVLLPLLGSIQTSSDIAPIQMVSLAFLAFQNGFFWKLVIERVGKNT